jgi:hypothetical protein
MFSKAGKCILFVCSFSLGLVISLPLRAQVAREVVEERGTGLLQLSCSPLVKTGGRLVKHARYYWLLLAEGHLHRRLFGQMLRRIYELPVPSG